jgi:hypothetical protein
MADFSVNFKELSDHGSLVNLKKNLDKGSFSVAKMTAISLVHFKESLDQGSFFSLPQRIFGSWQFL